MIKKFDIFGTFPKFYYQGKGIYQTYFGSMMSILLLGTAVLSFIFYGKELFEKQNPQTIFTEEYVEKAETYTFSKNKKSIALGLQNFALDSIHFIDESYYSLEVKKAKFENVINEETGEIETEVKKEKITLRNCQKDDFIIPETTEYFHNLSFMEQLYCFDNYSEDQHIEIQGDFGQDVFQRLEFRFKMCQNSTENQNSCQTQEEIDNRLEGSYMAIYYTDEIVQPKNYTHPFKSIGRDSYFSSSNKVLKQINMFFRNVYIESNNGLIWDNFIYNQTLILGSEREQTFSSPNDDGTFFYIQMRLEKLKQSRYYRTYLNVATVLAQVGGILKIVSMAFWFLSYVLSTRDLNLSILNQIFNFKYQHQQKNDIKQNQNLNNQQQKSKNQSSQDSKLKQFVNDLKGSLSLNTIKSFFSVKMLDESEKEQKQLFQIANNQIKEELDFVRIIKKIQEIDKIKSLLLDEDQIQLFEQISKKVISYEDYEQNQQNKKNLQASNGDSPIKNQKTMRREDMEDYQTELNFKKSFLSFKRIFSKPERSRIDAKVLKLMDKNVLSKFIEINNCEESVQNIEASFLQNDQNNNNNQGISILQVPGDQSITSRNQCQCLLQQHQFQEHIFEQSNNNNNNNSVAKNYKDSLFINSLTKEKVKQPVTSQDFNQQSTVQCSIIKKNSQVISNSNANTQKIEGEEQERNTIQKELSISQLQQLSFAIQDQILLKSGRQNQSQIKNSEQIDINNNNGLENQQFQQKNNQKSDSQISQDRKKIDNLQQKSQNQQEQQQQKYLEKEIDENDKKNSKTQIDTQKVKSQRKKIHYGKSFTGDSNDQIQFQ